MRFKSTVQLDSGLVIPAGAGAGKVLTSDASGNASWQSIAASGATLVSSLPASPTDGQEVYYLADATNGIVWHLRYRTASASAYKWEFVGGPSKRHEIPYSGTIAASQTTSTTYADLNGAGAVVGPTITLPLAGDYEFHEGAQIQPAASAFAFAGIRIGAVDPTDEEAIFGNTSASVTQFVVGKTMVRNVAAANTTVKLVYKTSTGTAVFFRRSLFARPLRVG